MDRAELIAGLSRLAGDFEGAADYEGGRDVMIFIYAYEPPDWFTAFDGGLHSGDNDLLVEISALLRAAATELGE